jgi:Leucine-rich repeat (LRR) protein
MSFFSESRALEVLDLHNNHIACINVNGLLALKILNLEGNCIIHANRFEEVSEITDLNLKRNKIESIGGIGHLSGLKKFFLSHNQIANFSDCLEVFKLVNLVGKSATHMTGGSNNYTLSSI